MLNHQKKLPKVPYVMQGNKGRKFNLDFPATFCTLKSPLKYHFKMFLKLPNNKNSSSLKLPYFKILKLPLLSVQWEARLVRWTADRAVRVRALAGARRCVLGKETLDSPSASH